MIPKIKTENDKKYSSFPTFSTFEHAFAEIYHKIIKRIDKYIHC